MAKITLVRGKRCRRSDRIVGALQAEGIPFRLVPTESDEGRELIARHDLRASPGILVDDHSINPFDLIHDCRVDSGAVHRLLLEEEDVGPVHDAEAVSGSGRAAGP